MSTSSFALAPGTVFHGRYSVVRCIKAGGMGAVYEVTDAKTASRRALKVMLPTLVEEEDFRTRFELEAKITGDVDSDHLVRVFDAGIDEPTTTPFLVMELLRGEEIGSIIKRAPLAPADAVVYLHQAALALDKTHAAGIIHRDLKPENLFLTRRDDGTPCVKILDFGIAKVVEQNQARATRAIGTPLYMSPEQIQGEGAIDGRADVYSLGHIAYTILVGEAYWKEESRAYDSTFPLLNRVLKGPTERPTERALRRKRVILPAAFDAWFWFATATRTEDRFATATASIAAFGEALGISITRPRASYAAESSGTNAFAAPMSSDPSGGSARGGAALSSVDASSASLALTTSPSAANGANQSGGGRTSKTGGVATLSEPPTRPTRNAKAILIVGALVVLLLGIGFALVRMATAPASSAVASAPTAAIAAPSEAAPPPGATVAPVSPSASVAEPAPSAPAPTASAHAKSKPPAATPHAAPAQAAPKHEGMF